MEKVLTIERLKLSVMLKRKLVVNGVDSLKKLLDIKNNKNIVLSKEDIAEIEECVKSVGLVLYSENKFVENLNLSTKLKNVLKRTGVNSVEELKNITKEQLLKFSEVGELSAERIISEILKK